MPSSMVLSQLNSFWGKAVYHAEERPRISVTLVRKSFVRKVRMQKPKLGKGLADLMCQSEDTAKRSYFFQEKNKQAGGMSATLLGISGENGKAINDEHKERDVIKTCFKEDIERKKSQ